MPRRNGPLTPRQRQADPKDRTVPAARIDQIAAKVLCDLAADRQSQTRTARAAALRQAGEFLEDDALALLGDADSIPHFQAKLRQEPNPRLRLAYVSALGMLRVERSVEQLFDLLQPARSEVSRGEIGLAIARIVGDEK